MAMQNLEKNTKQDQGKPLEVVEAKRYYQTFNNLNFRSPFTNGINEKPIPKGLKGPRVTPYD